MRVCFGRTQRSIFLAGLHPRLLILIVNYGGGGGVIKWVQTATLSEWAVTGVNVNTTLPLAHIVMVTR